MTADRDWRERHAAQLEYLAGELGKALMEAENAEEVFELRAAQTALQITRGFTAALRSEINTMAAEARQLRAGVPEQVLQTTRFIRPAS